MGCVEITDRKFLTKVKVVSVNMDNNMIIVDNSEKYDWTDLVEVKIGEDNRFLFGYFKWCMESEKVVDIEINVDKKLIVGYIDVSVELIEDRSNNNKYVINPVVKVDGLPDSVEINIDKYDDRDRICFVFDNAIKKKELIN
jgi:hypothetical protein